MHNGLTHHMPVVFQTMAPLAEIYLFSSISKIVSFDYQKYILQRQLYASTYFNHIFPNYRHIS